MCAERHFFFVFVSIELLICDETPIKMYFCELLSFNIIIQKIPLHSISKISMLNVTV